MKHIVKPYSEQEKQHVLENEHEIQEEMKLNK